MEGLGIARASVEIFNYMPLRAFAALKNHLVRLDSCYVFCWLAAMYPPTYCIECGKTYRAAEYFPIGLIGERDVSKLVVAKAAVDKRCAELVGSRTICDAPGAHVSHMMFRIDVSLIESAPTLSTALADVV